MSQLKQRKQSYFELNWLKSNYLFLIWQIKVIGIWFSQIYRINKQYYYNLNAFKLIKHKKL